MQLKYADITMKTAWGALPAARKSRALLRVGCATCRQEKPRTAARLRLLTKKEKTGFFLLCGKQAKINVLIFRIFSCVSSILSATGWGLSAVSAAHCCAAELRVGRIRPEKPVSYIRKIKRLIFAD
ncbi:hypothetical protein JJB97_11885 [Enterobacterales bacterium BIT-L3]|uniref:Uncharacterized protein n=1 Tax=Tenebrionibacter intestinalis TaxID=2799638 RepID=A0A8K0XWZ1_9ENTR|nr:hypothetical protein [Tenebrionibacter intestinalis]